MIKVLLVVNHKKESEILALAFQQKSMKVISSQASYSNYIKSLQYMPDLVFIEIPVAYTDSIQFIRLIKKNKRTSRLPVVSYGSLTEKSVVHQLFLAGATKYYPRPLRFTEILHDLATLLKGKGMSVVGKEDPDSKKREEAIALILNKEKAGSDKVETMVDFIGKLLAFPFTVNRILKIADDANSGAPELGKVIKTDQAMTTTILKVANSVLFASRDRKIAEIKEAVVRIGFRETKNIALSMMVMKLFERDEKAMGYNRMDFWYHSLAVGVIAERIAKQAGFSNPEEAFVAGLLHDFGILLLDEFFPEVFEKIIELTTKQGGSFYAAEKELIGISHNDFLAKLFDNWSIPRNITQSIVYQMDFTTFRDEANPELTKLVMITGMANILAKTIDVGKECDMVVQPLPDPFFPALRFAAGFRDSVFDEIYAGINMYSRFLNLEPKTFPESRPLEDAKQRIMLVNRTKALFEPHMFYLRNLGYPLIDEAPLSGIREAGQLPELIVINTDDNTEPADIAAFTETTLPVLVFISSEKSKCEVLPASPTRRKLYKTLDLRQIDLAVETLAKPRG